MADPVALFIDLENIATSLWNMHHQTPDLFGWMEKVRKYGSLAFGRAYGDFSQPGLAAVEADLRNLGIDRFDCKAKQNGQSTVDSNVVIDLYELAIDQPAVKTFVLMAGDSDYIRVVARLRQRFDKQIVIMGIPGTVSRDLVRAAGMEDPLLPISAPDLDELQLIRVIQQFEATRHEGTYPTFRYMRDYVAHPRNESLIRPQLVENALSDFIQRGVLVQETIDLPDGRVLKTTHLNREDPLVIEALNLNNV